MKRKRSVLLAAMGAGVLALGALPSAGHADVASTCDQLIGSGTGQIDLSPLAKINLATCQAATAPTCGSSSPINLGVVTVGVAICKP